MDFGFDRAHGDAVKRELEGGIGGAGAMVDGLRDFGDGKRVDELGQGADVQCGAKFGGRLVATMQALRERESGGEDSAAVKEISSG
jgi:hypothetical protein